MTSEFYLAATAALIASGTLATYFTVRVLEERDWRVADMANPATPGGGFAFGSATWITNEPQANLPSTAPGGSANQNNVSQAAVDALFPLNGCPNPNTLGPGTGTVPPLCRQPVGTSNGAQAPGVGAARFRLNRDGTIFSGLQDPGSSNSGAYKFNGPVWGENGGSGDLDGAFQGLPVFVRMPNGGIKENVMYSWASSPLERLAGFGSGHYEITDNMRLTGQFSVARTKTESSLGLASAAAAGSEAPSAWAAQASMNSRLSMALL